MARPIDTPLAGEIWHLSIDDLFAPVNETPRLGGIGPFVINLSVSTAPIDVPTDAFAGWESTHVYQIQVIEDGRTRYRLRLGPFEYEDEAEAILVEIRDVYPAALTATATDADMRVIESLRVKREARSAIHAWLGESTGPNAALPATAARFAFAPTPTATAQTPPAVSAPMEATSMEASTQEASTQEANTKEAAIKEAANKHVAIKQSGINQAAMMEAALIDAVSTVAAVAKVGAPVVSSAAPPPSSNATTAPASYTDEPAPPKPVTPVELLPTWALPAHRGRVSFDQGVSVPADAMPVLTDVVATAPRRPAPQMPMSQRPLQQVRMQQVRMPHMPMPQASPREASPPQVSLPQMTAPKPSAMPAATTRMNLSAAKAAPTVSAEVSASVAARPAAAGVTPPAAAGSRIAASSQPSGAVTPPAVAQPTAATPRVQSPQFYSQVQAPRAPASQLQARERAPQVTAPQFQARNRATPVAAHQFQSQVQLPQVQAQASQVPAPQVHASIQAPQVQAPHVHASMQLPQTKAPKIATPAVTAPVPSQPAAAPRAVKQLNSPLPELESTQTVRALTPLEIEDAASSKWFVIQLSLADHAFDPDSVPNLDIFSEYRLYSVAGLDQGRVVHALRLGFFSEEFAAVAVASYLGAYYDKPAIKRVSVAERERFSHQRVEARKDVGASGKHAVIEITGELVTRRGRTTATHRESPGQPSFVSLMVRCSSWASRDRYCGPNCSWNLE